jgi:hypothetical protein
MVSTGRQTLVRQAIRPRSYLPYCPGSRIPEYARWLVAQMKDHRI